MANVDTADEANRLASLDIMERRSLELLMLSPNFKKIVGSTPAEANEWWRYKEAFEAAQNTSPEALQAFLDTETARQEERQRQERANQGR